MNRYEALQHAVRAHGDETDWGGQLYVLHPMAVADRINAHWAAVPGTAFRHSFDSAHSRLETLTVVALLHDVLEDTNYELKKQWLSASQWETLYRVTRWPGETYREYIEKAAESPFSIIVKLADLSHNMSAERKVGLTEKQLEAADGLREKRYEPSRDRLWEALGAEWWPA